MSADPVNGQAEKPAGADADGQSGRGGRRSGPAGGRRRARLGAVQALYQMELTDAPVERVVPEFVAHRFGAESEDLPPADIDLFRDLVLGAVRRQSEVDRAIARALARGWTLARLDSTLRALLRAGTYELIARPDVPVAVAVNEYVELAHAFFSGSEPGFVNGVLDRIAREAREGGAGRDGGR